MTDSIKSLFQKNIELINLSGKTITYIRKQNFNKALSYSVKTIDIILLTIEDTLSNQVYFNGSSLLMDNNYINEMLRSLLEAQENKDYILLADLFEMQLNPFILSLQEFIINKEGFIFDEELYNLNMKVLMNKDINLGEQLQQSNSPLELIEAGYSLEYTSCGRMTLALYDKNGKYYMHSNGQVNHEAGELAREWFSNDMSKYIIYGLGLAYHIMELMELDDSIEINVYESDLNVIQVACAFSDLGHILSSDRVSIIYDPHFEKLSTNIREMDEVTRYVIHYPSLRNIKDSMIREQLEDFFISYSSVNNQLHSLNNNFRKNILQYDEYVDSLYEQFKGKDLYVIAAGPSLDKNYIQLKNLGDNAIILATGTVLKKLLLAGIVPNYVILIDANASVFKQIKDIDKTQIPLLFLSTVYHKVPALYQGKKFLICQEGFEKAEDYGSEKGYNLFQTGGSVSTTALEIGIRFDCKRIIYVGLDLAYTNNYDHASGTAATSAVTQNNLRQVKDIYGNMVGTSKNLDIYRKWIERRIKDVKGIEFIDATEGGAKIEGMKISKLKDCINAY